MSIATLATLVLCVVEQRGPNSINGISTSPELSATQGDRNLVLAYIDSVSDTFYFLDKMKCEIERLVKIQTRDCQTFQTGNHYVTLTFRTFDKRNHTYYNLSFSTKFKQSSHQILGNQIINVSYSTDLVVNKKDRDKIPFTNHTIGIDDNTMYYRNNIYSSKINSQDSCLTSLPFGYLINDLLNPDYNLDLKLNPDTCVIT